MVFKKYLHRKSRINSSYSFKFKVQYVRNNEYQKSYSNIVEPSCTPNQIHVFENKGTRPVPVDRKHFFL